MGVVETRYPAVLPFYTERTSDGNGHDLGSGHPQRVHRAVDFAVGATFVSARTKRPRAKGDTRISRHESIAGVSAE